MKLEQGKQYGQWIYEGEYKAPPDRQGGTCHLCGKVRGKIFRFELKNSNNEMIEFTELGSECLKHFDFKQCNPYTNLQGINTSL